MRRSLTILSTVLLFGILACEKGEECKECKEVEKKNGQVEDESSYQEYCGDELDEKENYHEEAGNLTIEYECRS